MKIIVITQRLYLPYFYGGAEVAVHELCLGLTRCGDDPRVVSARYRRSPGAASRWLFSVVARRRPFATDGLMGYPVFRGSCELPALRKLLQSEKPDAVAVNGWYALQTALELREWQIPTALHLHNVSEFEDFNYADPNLDGVQFVSASRFIADRFVERFGKRSTVILNIINPERYRVPYSGDKILFINPRPVKGVAVALELAKRLPELPFLFVDAWNGWGREREWQEKAHSLSNIEWRRSTTDMRTVYREAKVLIVPSQCEEGWGRVVSEAQVSGIPVIASARGALPEAVGPGGVVLPHDDVEAWHSEVADLYHNDERRLALSAQAIAHANRPEIQPKVIINQYRDFIADLAKGAADALSLF